MGRTTHAFGARDDTVESSPYAPISRKIVRSPGLPSSPAVGLCVALTLGLAISGCSAANYRPLSPDYERLADTEIERRTQFIERRLEASQKHAEIWRGFWFGVDVGPGIALGVALGATADNGAERAGAIVNGVTATMGLIYLYANPLNARFGADPIREMPAATRAERIARLQRAEIILQENAARARQRKSWLVHLGNLAVAGIGAGVVAGAGGDPTEIALTGGSELLGGEIQFWTEPGAPASDLVDYREFLERGTAHPLPSQTRLRWRSMTNGLAFDFRF